MVQEENHIDVLTKCIIVQPTSGKIIPQDKILNQQTNLKKLLSSEHFNG